MFAESAAGVKDGKQKDQRQRDARVFFTTKFAEKARRSQRGFGRVTVHEFLMAEMLKRVQHDGRVGFSGLPKSLFMIVTLNLFQGLF